MLGDGGRGGGGGLQVTCCGDGRGDFEVEMRTAAGGRWPYPCPRRLPAPRAARRRGIRVAGGPRVAGMIGMTGRAWSDCSPRPTNG